MKHRLADVAEIGIDHPDAIARHNLLATMAVVPAARRDAGSHCPAMEEKTSRCFPTFLSGPFWSDNNLSGRQPTTGPLIRRYLTRGGTDRCQHPALSR